jgi:hypothetical protein
MKKDRSIARIIGIVLSLVMIIGVFGSLPAFVSRVEASPTTEIWDWYDLDAIRNNLSGNYTLMNDLDSSTAGYTELASSAANGGQGWQPIGTCEPFVPFTGTLDGQGYEICDLFMNHPNECGLGLFSAVGYGGIIENVGIVNADMSGYGVWVDGVMLAYGIGALAASSAGTISNCYSTGAITGECSVGGLVAYHSGTMDNCYSACSVGDGAFVGGLIASNSGNLSNSYFTGSLTCQDWGVGGLIAVNYGTVSNSHYNYDEVLTNGENIITIGALFDEDFDEWLANNKSLDVNERLSQEDGYYLINSASDFKELLAFGQDDSLKFRLKNDLDLDNDPGFYIPYLGGEFDGNGHKISNLSFNFLQSYQVGLFGCIALNGVVSELGVENVNINVGNRGSSVAGLAGVNQGIVSNTYSTGSVAGFKSLGGLVGENDGTVSKCYSSTTVTSKDIGYDVGGLVGWNHGIVSNSYSSGSVTGGWSQGGLVGWNWGTVNSSYSTGNVTGYEGLPKSLGGLVGQNNYTVRNSFWDRETSGMEESAGGTGKTMVEMRNIITFTDTKTEGLDETWDIIAVDSSLTNATYTWNIVDEQTYPFLGWESGKYQLTILSTEGGSVTATVDGDETVVGSGDTQTISDISPGTVVVLVANPDAEYEFVGWQGGPINGSTNLSTNITMGIHYSIAADFEAPLPPTSGGGCFIATAAYGTPMAKEVQTLRDFRDQYLLINSLGQALVAFYYKVSPPIAEFITDHPSLKPIVRAGLVPVVAISTVAVNTTGAEKIAILGLLVVVSVAVAIWVTRRRGRDSEYT